MKLTRQHLSLNIKAILLLTMLFSNIFISANEKVKLEKTISRFEGKRIQSRKSKSHSSSKRRSGDLTIEQQAFSNRLKPFLVGFFTVFLVQALKQDEGVVSQFAKTAVDWCSEATVKEYDLIKSEMVRNSPCNPDIVKELLVFDYDQIVSLCAKLETARETDSKEYSGLSVLKQKFFGLFSANKEFDDAYQKF